MTHLIARRFYRRWNRLESADPHAFGSRSGIVSAPRSSNEEKIMINKVILVGRLGKDPETRSTPGGTTVSKFTLATDEKFTDKQGERQERTEWHNIVAWGKLGEICGQYLRKGKLVYIEGSIRTDSWDDKESGQKRYRTEIVASTMKKHDRRLEEGCGSGVAQYSGSLTGEASAPDTMEEDEDVPF
jgi:single-strand DNA-binding protein